MIPNTVEDLAGRLDEFDYFSDESLTVAIHIAVQLGRLLFVEWWHRVARARGADGAAGRRPVRANHDAAAGPASGNASGSGACATDHCSRPGTGRDERSGHTGGGG